MKGGVAVFRSAPELIRNNDAHYKYRPDSDFFYLTGYAEPDCVMVLAPEHPEHKFILFVRPRDPERETWDGKRAGVEGAVNIFGADIAYNINELDEKLPEYILSKIKFTEPQKNIHDAMQNLRLLRLFGIEPDESESPR